MIRIITLIALISTNAFFGASSFGAISLKDQCIEEIGEHPHLIEQYQDMCQKIGEKRAAQRLINSFKGTSEPLEPMLPPLITYETPEMPINLAILDSEKSTFDLIKAYKQAINKGVKIDATEAIRLCVQIGPARSAELFRKIIIAYPEHHDGLLHYFNRPELHHINYAFPIDPTLHPEDETSGLPFIKLMAQQGHKPSQEHCAEYRAKKEAEEAERLAEQLKEQRELEATQKKEAQKRKAEMEKKERALAAKKLQEQKDQTAYQRACSFIKAQKYTPADKILLDLANRGHLLAKVKRGRIHEKLMYQAMTDDFKNLQTQKKSDASTSASMHMQRALSLYIESGKRGCAHGYVRAARLHEGMADHLDEKHALLAQLAFDQAQKTQSVTTTDQPIEISKRDLAFLNKGKAAEKQLLEIWKNATAPINLKQVKALEACAITYYKRASQHGSEHGWTHLGTMHHILADTIMQYHNKQARHFFENAIKVDPQHAKALSYLSCYYANEGNVDQAIELLKRACLSDNTPPSALSALYQLCSHLLTISQDNIDRVKELIILMERTDGQSALTWNLHARCASLEKDVQKAIEYYVKAGERGASSAWYYAGIETQKMGNLKDAKAYYKHACNSKNPYGPAFTALGNLYKNEGKSYKARKAYHTATAYGDHKGMFRFAECMHYGIGGIQYLEKATLLYDTIGQEATDVSLKNTSAILARITKAQNLQNYEPVPAEEVRRLQDTIKMFTEKKQIPGNDILNRFIAESHFAQAKTHMLGAAKLTNALNTYIKASRDCMATMQKGSPEHVSALTTFMTQVKKHKETIHTHSCQALEELKASLSGQYDFRCQMVRAVYLQKIFFPEKMLAEMSPQEQKYCKEAIMLYKSIISACAETDPDNYYLCHARYSLSLMYNHLCPDTAHEKTIEAFTLGTSSNPVRRHLNLAEAHHRGLLSDDEAPDYHKALEHIEQALHIKPNNQRLRKERVLYRYATRAALNTLEQSFIDECELSSDEMFGIDLLQLGTPKRLTLYMSIDFDQDSLTINSGPRAGQAYTIAGSKEALSEQSLLESQPSSSPATASSAAASSSSSSSSRARRKPAKKKKGKGRRKRR